MKIFDYIVIILSLFYILRLGFIFPSLWDELIVLGFIFYITLKASKPHIRVRKKRTTQNHQKHYTYSEPPPVNNKGSLNLTEAYKVLGLLPGASLEDAKKAYKEKIAKNHPDKVSHLSKELQERAKELTIQLNESYSLISSSQKK